MIPLSERKLSFYDLEDQQQKKGALWAYVTQLFQRIFQEESQDYFKKMIKSRWKSVAPLFQDYINPELCNFKKYQSKDLDLTEDLDYAQRRFDRLLGESSEERMKKEANSRAIRTLEVFDYVENLISNVVGAEWALFFLENCILE